MNASTSHSESDTPMFLPYAPFALVSVVHVIALAIGASALAEPTKLLLMPLLAVAVIWDTWRLAWTASRTLLLAAIGLSWLGDGAGAFFPFAPTLPLMLLFFGLAHLAYMWLFARYLAVRTLSWWALVYVAWWVVLVVVLWPHLGGLSFAVAAYGLVLGGTAALATRCHPLIIVGAVFFLASDTILAFRLFLADAMPEWTSPAVMVTYCLGQGLIAAGAVATMKARSTMTEAR